MDTSLATDPAIGSVINDLQVDLHNLLYPQDRKPDQPRDQGNGDPGGDSNPGKATNKAATAAIAKLDKLIKHLDDQISHLDQLASHVDTSAQTLQKGIGALQGAVPGLESTVAGLASNPFTFPMAPPAAQGGSAALGGLADGLSQILKAVGLEQIGAVISGVMKIFQAVQQLGGGSGGAGGAQAHPQAGQNLLAGLPSADLAGNPVLSPAPMTSIASQAGASAISSGLSASGTPFDTGPGYLDGVPVSAYNYQPAALGMQPTVPMMSGMTAGYPSAGPADLSPMYGYQPAMYDDGYQAAGAQPPYVVTSSGSATDPATGASVAYLTYSSIDSSGGPGGMPTLGEQHAVVQYSEGDITVTVEE